MKLSIMKALTTLLIISSSLLFTTTIHANCRHELRKEYREGQRDIYEARKEMREEIRDADNRWEAKRAYRKGMREIEKERRETRRKMRREFMDDDCDREWDRPGKGYGRDRFR
jgi:hypothetical protein